MRWLLVLPLAGALVAPLAAQDSTAKRPDSVAVDTSPPTPAQIRWMEGLRVAARGVSQIRSGIERVQRADQIPDSVRLKNAGQLLGGVCGTARGFMRSGRLKMSATAYQGPKSPPARAVAMQIDSLIVHATTCEHSPARALRHTVQDMVEAVRRYEGAIGDWRTMMGLNTKRPGPEVPATH